MTNTIENTQTVTPADVAAWMLAEVTNQKSLWQTDAADEIERRFGSEFIYENERGTPCISKAVLREFRKISEDTVVWEKGYRTWRLRDKSDPSGRRQVDY